MFERRRNELSKARWKQILDFPGPEKTGRRSARISSPQTAQEKVLVLVIKLGYGPEFLTPIDTDRNALSTIGYSERWLSATPIVISGLASKKAFDAPLYIGIDR